MATTSFGRVTPRAVPALPVRLLDKYFYFGMSLLITAVVTYGFSHTVDQNLLHPSIPRPLLLWFHAVVFTGWLGLFIVQSALVRTRNVRIHRKVGWIGAAMGAVMPVLGVSTAVVMARFETYQLHQRGAASFMMVPFFDMACFTSTFWLAVYWRRKPEFHRRLVMIATCSLAAAGFGRFPEFILPHIAFYAGVDALILLGVVRDLIVNHRIHRVYLYVLPTFAVLQFGVMYTIVSGASLWQKIADAIVG
jgi:hypothetical protein